MYIHARFIFLYSIIQLEKIERKAYTRVFDPRRRKRINLAEKLESQTLVCFFNL